MFELFPMGVNIWNKPMILRDSDYCNLDLGIANFVPEGLKERILKYKIRSLLKMCNISILEEQEKKLR
jgi:hypothetical protein